MAISRVVRKHCRSVSNGILVLKTWWRQIMTLKYNMNLNMFGLQINGYALRKDKQTIAENDKKTKRKYKLPNI